MKTAMVVGICTIPALAYNMQFCEGADPAIGPCVSVPIVPNQCQKVPDLGTKGDAGSSYEVSS